MRNFFIFEGRDQQPGLTGNPKKDFLWLRTSRASVAFTLEFYRLETFRLNLYSFLLHVLNGNWNAKHCHANTPCHDLIASSFNGAPAAHCKEWFDLFNRSGLREWDNKWEASKGKTAMEGGRRGHSATLAGSTKRDKGRLIMSEARRRGRGCLPRRQSFSSLSRRAPKLREREQ